MKKFLFVALSVLVISIACNKPSVTKKVLIVGRGKITVQDNKVTMTDGSSYSEEIVDINDDKAVSWNVATPTGTTTVNIPQDKGFYLLNLKTDTLVGSYQNLNTDLGGRTMTQEELKVKIDSLIQLTKGANVSSSSRSYFILPNNLVKVTENIEAKIFGPFTKVPGSFEMDKNGKAPEVYKFYTNTELRDLIVRLKKNTI